MIKPKSPDKWFTVKMFDPGFSWAESDLCMYPHKKSLSEDFNTISSSFLWLYYKWKYVASRWRQLIMNRITHFVYWEELSLIRTNYSLSLQFLLYPSFFPNLIFCLCGCEPLDVLTSPLCSCSDTWMRQSEIRSATCGNWKSTRRLRPTSTSPGRCRRSRRARGIVEVFTKL